MALSIDCAKLYPECTYQAIGETEDEVLMDFAAHLKNDHALEITGEVAERIRGILSDAVTSAPLPR